MQFQSTTPCFFLTLFYPGGWGGGGGRSLNLVLSKERGSIWPPTPHSFLKFSWKNPEWLLFYDFKFVLLLHLWNLVWIAWLVVKLQGIVSVFDNIFWIFEHFVISKVHVLDTVKRNFEDMLNYKIVAFIGWKQNEDCILHAKVRIILLEKLIFQNFVDVSKTMGSVFESSYVVQLSCLESSLWHL